MSKKIRFEALDALRGLAILMMVLSGTIPHDGALPAWMYHAQVPPPDHVFDSSVPGITWVDLVFPMFLFSMGAAIPFSFGSRIDRGESRLKMFGHLFWRFAGLALFAIVSQHARPYGMEAGSVMKWVLALLAMGAMILIFAAPTSGWWSRNKKWVSLTGWGAAIALFGMMDHSGVQSFSLQNFDIIIMILANTALAGGLLYVLYRKWWHALWVTMALMVTFFLSGRDGGNWVSVFYEWSPVSWLISWNYLKYMIVLIPGIFTGVVVREQLSGLDHAKPENNACSLLILILSLGVLIISVVGLYLRAMTVSLILTTAALAGLYFLVRRWKDPWRKIFMQLFPLIVVLIIGGYFLEPLHGGIKKDPATLSYLVLTAGLSMVALLVFVVLLEDWGLKKHFFLLSGSGKNAMMAYVAGSNLVMPLLALTGLTSLFESQTFPVTLQVIQAGIVTLGVAWVSAIAARYRLFMRV